MVIEAHTHPVTPSGEYSWSQLQRQCKQIGTVRFHPTCDLRRLEILFALKELGRQSASPKWQYWQSLKRLSEAAPDVKMLLGLKYWRHCGCKDITKKHRQPEHYQAVKQNGMIVAHSSTLSNFSRMSVYVDTPQLYTDATVANMKSLAAQQGLSRIRHLEVCYLGLHCRYKTYN
eukprot:2174875-Amphidinium_carterae.1